MGAKSRRVGRPSKNTRRVELRLNADHPMTLALEQEAEAHHVTLQQYITDLLLGRYLQQQQTKQHEEQDEQQDDPVTPPANSAAQLADEWEG